MGNMQYRDGNDRLVKYCTHCKKIRTVKIRTVKWFDDHNITYTFESCILCGSVYLLNDSNDDHGEPKRSKADKKAEKRHNQQQYRVTGWPTLG